MKQVSALIFHLLYLVTLPALVAEETVLGDRDRLIAIDFLDKIPSEHRAVAQLNETFRIQSGFGRWGRQAEEADTVEAIYVPEHGHVPAFSLHGDYHAVIVDLEVKLTASESSSFRITLNNQKLFKNHLLAIWLNANNDFVKTGLLAEQVKRVSKPTERMKVERKDFLHVPLSVETGVWIPMTIEIVGDRFAIHCLGERYEGLAAGLSAIPKNRIGFTFSAGGHQLRNAKVWSVKPDGDGN